MLLKIPSMTVKRESPSTDLLHGSQPLYQGLKDPDMLLDSNPQPPGWNAVVLSNFIIIKSDIVLTLFSKLTPADGLLLTQLQ